MSNTSHTYDKAANLRANSFSKTGYYFAGWATSSGGSKVYNDKASVTNLTSTNGGTVNLYAKWVPNTYHITYNPSTGASGSAVTQDYAYDTTYYFPDNSFDRAYTDNHGSSSYYHLLGWSTSNHKKSPSLPASEAAKLVTYSAGSTLKNLRTDSGTTNLWAVMTPGVIQLENKSSGYGWVQGGIYGYLWHEHPIGDKGHYDTIGGTGNTVFRYSYDQTFDIKYAKYFVFDLNMVDDKTAYGDNFKKLISYSNGQIEFASDGRADGAEHNAGWKTIWDNAYYINNNNAGWQQIYIPMSIFGGSADLSKINFVGVYWNATSSTVTTQFANPTFRYTLPANAQKIR